MQRFFALFAALSALLFTSCARDGSAPLTKAPSQVTMTAREFHLRHHFHRFRFWLQWFFPPVSHDGSATPECLHRFPFFSSVLRRFFEAFRIVWRRQETHFCP